MTSEPALVGPSLSVPILRRALRRAIPIGLVAASLILYAAVLFSSSHQDLQTYLAAGHDLAAGRPLYATFLHHPFPDATLRPAYIYPPAFALLMVPLTWLPPGMAAWPWLLAMQAALALGMATMLRLVRPGGAAIWVALLLTFSFYPLLVDIAQGQANLLVLALLVLGIAGILQGHSVAGTWLGAAAALKLTPVLLVGWLLWTRRWQAAALVALGFGAVTGLGALIRPGDTVTFFRQVLPALAQGTAYYSNQSVAGVLGRLLTANAYTDPWIRVAFEPALVVAAGAALLAVWAINARRLDPVAAAFSFVPALPLLSAVTWEHHLVLLLPVIWLAAARLAGRGWPLPGTGLLGVAVACLSLLPRWHPGPAFGSTAFRAAQTGDPFVLLAANALFAGTLILFLGSRWLLPSRQARIHRSDDADWDARRDER